MLPSYCRTVSNLKSGESISSAAAVVTIFVVLAGIAQVLERYSSTVFDVAAFLTNRLIFARLSDGVEIKS